MLSEVILFYCDQFIGSGAEADFLSVGETIFPSGFRGCVDEMIVVVTEAILMHTVIKKASRKRILCIACVHAGLIQRNRVEACEHSDIRKDRHIVFTVAVAVRGNVDHQIDMEIRAPIQNRLGILGDFHIKFLHRGRILVVDGIKIAGSEATAASDTSAVVNGGTTVFIKRNRSVGTVLCTGPAAYTAGNLLSIFFLRSVQPFHPFWAVSGIFHQIQ